MTKSIAGKPRASVSVMVRKRHASQWIGIRRVSQSVLRHLRADTRGLPSPSMSHQPICLMINAWPSEPTNGESRARILVYGVAVLAAGGLVAALLRTNVRK